jgi:hypothetical protein
MFGKALGTSLGLFAHRWPSGHAELISNGRLPLGIAGTVQFTRHRHILAAV